MLEVIRRETEIMVKALHVGGGLSASDAACQAQADVLGMPVPCAER
jgi:glycerol kinase